MHLEFNIDSFIRFRWKKFKKKDPDCAEEILDEFTRTNPKYYWTRKRGWSTKGVPRYFKSYKIKKGEIAIARGAKEKLLKILKKYDHTATIHDNRISFPPVMYHSNIILREEQKEPVKIILSDEEGLIRGPCSSGKTIILLQAIALSKQPACVLVWNTTHQKQWFAAATDPKLLNLKKSEIGGVGGIFKKRSFGKLNICMQQSMYRSDNLEFFVDRCGFVGGDEVQRFGAKTFQEVINQFPAKYRIGVSADETRGDGLQSLIYNSFGKVLHDIPDKNISSRRKAKIYFIRTKFYNEHFVTFENPFGLVTALTKDQDRNKLIVRCVKKVSLGKGRMTLILTERKHHALLLNSLLSQYRTGLLIGNATAKELREAKWPKKWKAMMADFDSDAEERRIKSLAKKKKIDVIISTQKGNVGLNILQLEDVHITTPSSVRLLNQQKGRVERECKGTAKPRVIYYWDNKMEKLGDVGRDIISEFPKTIIVKKRRKK